MRQLVALRAASRRLKRELHADRDLEAWVDLAMTFQYRNVSITPIQVRSEIEALLSTVQELRPKIVLEVGSAEGGTLFLFTRVASEDATLVSLDLPFGVSRRTLYHAFVREEQTIQIVRADSQDPATARAVEPRLGGRRVDFLFTDGDHSYKGVNTDFRLYSRLVRDGGCIAFHDIVPGPGELVGGVPRFWSELKQSGDVQELVADWDQGGYGIGVLRVPEGKQW